MAGGWVEVAPSGISFEVGPGETVFEAAGRHGYHWPTICGGLGTCRTCVMTVVAGGDACSAIGPWEAEGLAEIGVARGAEPVRMACQTRVGGVIRVRKPGVRLL